jgi:hypothetical protein
MSLPNKTMLKRLVAIALCLVALNVYVAIAPVTVRATSCTCQNCNQCLNGQRCVCFYQGIQCIGGQWNDDNSCKCKTDCGGGG